MITWRVPVTALAMAAVLASVGYVVFPRAPQPARGTNVRLPDRRPAADAAGAAGWAWPDGVPGWQPGERYHGFDVTFMQPIEVQAAQLAAARNILDADDVRVLDSERSRPGSGPLAILATHTLDVTPEMACLAALLPGDAPVVWQCPHDLAHAHVLVAAARLARAGEPLYLVGVARGDVRRVVLDGCAWGKTTLYTRGPTWGQFDSACATSAHPRLLVYGHGRLLEIVRLELAPGAQSAFR